MLKVLDEACRPTRGSKYSACIDLRSRVDMTIGAGETVLIPLGVKIDIDFREAGCTYQNPQEPYEELLDYEKAEKLMDSHYLQLMLRSSLSKDLIIANGVGVIDMDYEGEIMIRVHNPTKPYYISNENRTYVRGTNTVSIKKGQRVAQITMLEHKGYLFGIDTEDKRDGGFGSTDKNKG